MNAVLEKRLGIRCQPGYVGTFTRREASGAIPNDSRVVKAQADDDPVPKGAKGTVLGSYFDPHATHRQGGHITYFVEWDATPGKAVAVLGPKIARDLAAAAH